MEAVGKEIRYLGEASKQKGMTVMVKAYWVSLSAEHSVVRFLDSTTSRLHSTSHPLHTRENARASVDSLTHCTPGKLHVQAWMQNEL